MRRFIFILAAFTLVAAAPACDNKQDAPADDEQAESEQPESSEEESGEDESSGDEEKGAASDGEKAEGDDGAEKQKEMESVDVDPALLKPGEADEEAPKTYKVKFETTAGDIVAEIHREWSPNGADRLYNLVKIGFYDNVAFFRVIDGFMAQFGMKGIPKVDEAWKDATIEDDPVEKPNERGYVTFAKRKEPNSRTTQLFINYRDNSKSLDKRGFAPVGKVVDGMDVVDDLYAGYGEGAPRGDGPSQAKIREVGNPYLKENFPKLDWVEEASIVGDK